MYVMMHVVINDDYSGVSDGACARRVRTGEAYCMALHVSISRWQELRNATSGKQYSKSTCNTNFIHIDSWNI